MSSLHQCRGLYELNKRHTASAGGTKLGIRAMVTDEKKPSVLRIGSSGMYCLHFAFGWGWRSAISDAMVVADFIRQIWLTLPLRPVVDIGFGILPLRII